MAVSKIVDYGKHTMKNTDYLNIIADSLHPYMTSVIPTGNGVFKTILHLARCVQWLEKYATEFQLKPWPLA